MYEESLIEMVHIYMDVHNNLNKLNNGLLKYLKKSYIVGVDIDEPTPKKSRRLLGEKQ